jgi:RNA polymerase sigma-54 factor
MASQEATTERGERDMVVDEGNGNSEDFERLAEFDDEFAPWLARSDTPARPRAAAGERDRKLDAMANTPARAESLNEYLHEQWAFVEAPAPVKEAGRLIIDNMDDAGYLRTALEELPELTSKPITIEQCREALQTVQTLEPTGVGARDLEECLLLQLDAEAAAGRDVSLERQLVQRFLRDIELNRLPQIARRTGKPIEQIKEALHNLSHLNPRPGLLIGQHAVPVIHPDVVVDVDDAGRVIVSLPDENYPRLHVSRLYRRMARDRGTERSARQFIRNNIRSAQWLISAIEQRQETVRRVAEEVFAVQREFLDAGEEALRPLPMVDVAGKVGVHVATVSRAVAGKYVQTPRGIYPLRMFFSGGTTTAAGQDVAWDAVKAKLKEVIDAEDKSKPLNDDELAAELRRNGITIARRTVAKYRKLMEIPAARQRRQY